MDSAGLGPGCSRALWICDYFPRPHDMTTGTWALESVVALQKAGLPAEVLAPTPWIPRGLPLGAGLKGWSHVPSYAEIRGVPVYYARCPHYPRKWVHDGLYTRYPFLDTALLVPWIRRVVDRIMDERPFDVVHANFIFPSGYLGAMIKRRYGVPLVVHERSVQRMANARDNAARGRAYRQVLREADVVVTENERMAAGLRELEPTIRDLRVFKQPGTHAEHVSLPPRSRPAGLAGKLVVLSVGTLSERKGHEYLIKAVSMIRDRYPDMVCRIIGDGPQKSRLQSLIRDLQLDGVVELLGRRPHEEVLAEMSWCDVFALASWGEAGGTVYGEAGQYAKPLVACTDEGIAEVMEDGAHGRLVPPRDAEALADALDWLLQDESRRKRIGADVGELVVKRLSYPQLARTLIEMYGALRQRRV